MRFPLVWACRPVASALTPPTALGVLVWLPTDANRTPVIPGWCPMEGASLTLSATIANGDPLELTCAAGHRWRSLLDDLDGGLHRAAAAADRER